jgi:hypothetical protein
VQRVLQVVQVLKELLGLLVLQVVQGLKEPLGLLE